MSDNHEIQMLPDLRTLDSQGGGYSQPDWDACIDACFAGNDIITSVLSEIMWFDVTKRLNLSERYIDLARRFHQTEILDSCLKLAQQFSDERQQGILEPNALFEEQRRLMLQDSIQKEERERVYDAFQRFTERLQVFACAYIDPLGRKNETILTSFSGTQFGSAELNRKATSSLGQALRTLHRNMLDSKSQLPTRMSFHTDRTNAEKGRFFASTQGEGRKVVYSGREMPEIVTVTSGSHVEFVDQVAHLYVSASLNSDEQKRAA